MAAGRRSSRGHRGRGGGDHRSIEGFGRGTSGHRDQDPGLVSEKISARSDESNESSGESEEEREVESAEYASAGEDGGIISGRASPNKSSISRPISLSIRSSSGRRRGAESRKLSDVQGDARTLSNWSNASLVSRPLSLSIRSRSGRRTRSVESKMPGVVGEDEGEEEGSDNKGCGAKEDVTTEEGGEEEGQEEVGAFRGIAPSHQGQQEGTDSMEKMEEETKAEKEVGSPQHDASRSSEESKPTPNDGELSEQALNPKSVLGSIKNTTKGHSPVRGGKAAAEGGDKGANHKTTAGRKAEKKPNGRRRFGAPVWPRGLSRRAREDPVEGVGSCMVIKTVEASVDEDGEIAMDQEEDPPSEGPPAEMQPVEMLRVEKTPVEEPTVKEPPVEDRKWSRAPSSKKKRGNVARFKSPIRFGSPMPGRGRGKSGKAPTGDPPPSQRTSDNSDGAAANTPVVAEKSSPGEADAGLGTRSVEKAPRRPLGDVVSDVIADIVVPKRGRLKPGRNNRGRSKWSVSKSCDTGPSEAGYGHAYSEGRDDEDFVMEDGEGPRRGAGWFGLFGASSSAQDMGDDTTYGYASSLTCDNTAATTFDGTPRGGPKGRMGRVLVM